MKIRKIGTIVALAAIMTVGGVYATFNYAQQGVTEAAGQAETVIAEAKNDLKKGTLTVVSTLKIGVDDKGFVGKPAGESLWLTAKTVEGSFKVTFTPTPGADKDVVDNGIVLTRKIAISLNDDTKKNEYTDAAGKTDAILTLDSDAAVDLNGGAKVIGEHDFADEISNAITVTEFSLPTQNDYDNYSALLKNLVITVTIAEK